jgi:hypothetical protein
MLERRDNRLESVGPERGGMINQAFIDAFEPERRSEYARQQRRRNRHRTMQAQTRPNAHPITQTHPPQPAGRSPLPSAREIDTALHVKYGATPYWELVTLRGW